jgi:hypothetical protein
LDAGGLAQLWVENSPLLATPRLSLIVNRKHFRGWANRSLARKSLESVLIVKCSLRLELKGQARSRQ